MTELHHTLAIVRQINAEANAKAKEVELAAESLPPAEVTDVDLSVEEIVRREGDGTAQHTREWR